MLKLAQTPSLSKKKKPDLHPTSIEKPHTTRRNPFFFFYKQQETLHASLFSRKNLFQGSEILPSQTLLVREPHFHLSLFSIIFQAEPRHFRRPPLDLHLADLSPPSSPLLPLLRGSTLLGKSGLVFPKLTKLLFI